MVFDTIIVGGGAAGMMAAISAADHDKKIVLIEQNEKLGKKIYITGKGRCNLTNACEEDVFFQNIIRNPKFLYSAYKNFNNKNTMDLVENAGCPLKTERGERVFPVSDHSSDIIKALSNVIKEKGVTILLNTKAEELIIENGRVCGVLIKHGNEKKSDKVLSDKVVVATGGLSYPTTGATGDGYRFARQAEHQIKEVQPSLVPLNIKETWCKELQGLALKNIVLTLKKEKKVLYEGFGEMLFTHFGISGPLVLSASCYLNEKELQECLITINLKPALTMEQLDQRLIREFDGNNKQFKNILPKLLPQKMVPIITELSGINENKKACEISKKERTRLIEVLRSLPLHIESTRGFNEAVITKGGISTKEIDPRTMESKKISGLYFAGEILDVDAFTGGFNLQIAFSTGYAAGEYRNQR